LGAWGLEDLEDRYNPLTMSSLAFLHTAEPNIAVFRELVARFDPSVPTRHELIDDVLAGAVGTGSVTDAMRNRTEATVLRLIAEGSPVVLCTCSTIGGVAEATPVPAGTRVIRVDRPMAEAAVASGRRILVAATLPSTLGPTKALLQNVADSQQRSIEMVDVLCEHAWPHFARGDRDAYADEIARAVAQVAGAEDIVVLAQASMAPAVSRLEARGIRALASPELGVRAALALYRRQ
jgi:hypothetical protein